MKKVIGMVLSVIIFAGNITLALAETVTEGENITEAVNLIVDGDFEGEYTPNGLDWLFETAGIWYYNSDGASLTTDEALNNKYLSISVNQGVGQTVNVEANTTYNISFDAKYPNGGEMYIQNGDETYPGSLNDTVTLDTIPIPQSEDWIKVTHTYTTDSSQEQLFFYIFCANAGSIDNVCVTKSELPETIGTMLYDGGFEVLEPTYKGWDWDPSLTGMWQVTASNTKNTENVYEGTYALMLSNCGLGQMVTLETEKIYTLTAYVKGTGSIQYYINDGLSLWPGSFATTPQEATLTDEWTQIILRYENTSLTTGFVYFWIPDNTTAYMDNVVLSEEEITDEDYVAQIGERKYLTLDSAVSAAAEGDTIEVLAEAEMTKNPSVPMTIEGNGNYITLNGVNYMNDIVFKNALLLGDKYNNITDTGSVFDGVEIDGFSADCLILNTGTIKNSEIKNYSGVLVIANNSGSGNLIENSTISDSIISGWYEGGNAAIRIYQDTAAVIKDSTITGTLPMNSGDDVYDVNVYGNGILTIQGNTYIGMLGNSSGAQGVIFDSDFKGTVTFKNVSVSTDTELATVREGADLSGVTVADLPEGYELIVDEGILKIAAKPAPEAYLTAANWTSSDEAYTANGNMLIRVADQEAVYGYKAELVGNGLAYSTVMADVTNTENVQKEVAYDSPEISGTGTIVFYIVSDAELDTEKSKVYCK